MTGPENYAYDMLSAEVKVLIIDVLSLAVFYPNQAEALGDKILKAMTTAFKLGHVQGKVDMEKAFMKSVPKLAERIVEGLKAREKEINEQGPSTNKSI